MLCAGKVPPDILKSSVYPYMGQLRKEVLVHSGFGEDSSIIDFGDKVAVVSTDTINCDDIHSGHLASTYPAMMSPPAVQNPSGFLSPYSYP